MPRKTEFTFSVSSFSMNVRLVIRFHYWNWFVAFWYSLASTQTHLTVDANFPRDTTPTASVRVLRVKGERSSQSWNFFARTVTRESGFLFTKHLHNCKLMPPLTWRPRIYWRQHLITRRRTTWKHWIAYLPQITKRLKCAWQTGKIVLWFGKFCVLIGHLLAHLPRSFTIIIFICRSSCDDS